MEKNIEQVAREEMQKVRDSSMAAGFFTGLKVIQDIVEDKKKSDAEKVNAIKEFIGKTLPVAKK